MTSITKRQHRNRRCRTLLGSMIVAVAVILGLSGAGQSHVGSTHASWTSEAHAAGVLQADTIPPAELTAECRYRRGLLGIGARVEIYWAAPDGYKLEDAELLASTSGLGSVLEPLIGYSYEGNTESTSEGYTTTVPTNLLGGLLGLGSELELAIVMTHKDHEAWTSEPASVSTNAGLVAGLGGSCDNLP